MYVWRSDEAGNRVGEAVLEAAERGVKIKIIKEGEGPGQGVGYLDDGTMVVVEGAASRIGADVESIVSSVLQSSAGRMIFTKPVHNAG